MCSAAMAARVCEFVHQSLVWFQFTVAWRSRWGCHADAEPRQTARPGDGSERGPEHPGSSAPSACRRCASGSGHRAVHDVHSARSGHPRGGAGASPRRAPLAGRPDAHVARALASRAPARGGASNAATGARRPRRAAPSARGGSRRSRARRRRRGWRRRRRLEHVAVEDVQADLAGRVVARRDHDGISPSSRAAARARGTNSFSGRAPGGSARPPPSARTSDARSATSMRSTSDAPGSRKARGSRAARRDASLCRRVARRASP